ncbi:MAG: hypothetical protein CMG46_02445 [Candidatus Marinimicrobia bacterium]|nr:hypothetical protein [Candidatus Neomarinimicrobiota bacterium]|tara:strand:+ start:869 stop:1678 length:810 start_codon:yes stop_codon:yes gene_type:complete
MEKDNEKYKSNPYNDKNILIQDTNIINIMSKLNINDVSINNINYYQRAFSHISYCKLDEYSKYKNCNNSIELRDSSYETLEFLGDSILGSIISEYLYERYYVLYNQNEGFLTKMKNKIVNGDTLSTLSSLLEFNKFIIISNHIEVNSTRNNVKRILEDVFEAFIGALYLDTKDYYLVKRFIISIIEKYIDFSDLIINDTNYKDQLLRYFQNNYKEYPIYNTFTDKSNKNMFTSKVFHNDKYISTGNGETKKKSEQDASKNALIHFGLLN